MQVNTIETLAACSKPQATTTSHSNSNLSFLSAIRQQIRQAPVNHDDSSAGLDVQDTPKNFHFGTNTCHSKKIPQSVIIDGEEWNDKQLAYCIDVWGNISTEKTINWNATGTDVLTQAQIKDLQERYDIENMSKQDFYDLLSDLTNLNAVSAQDCVHLFWVHSPEMNIPVDLCDNYNQQHLELNFVTRENSNLFRLMQLKLEHSLEMFNWVSSRSFDERNLSMPPLVKQRYVDALSAETASYQKFFSIFQSIQR